MKSESFHALTSKLTQLTPHHRSILSDRLREIEHASSVLRTLIEERLSNQRRFDANGYLARSFGCLGVPTINANIANKNTRNLLKKTKFYKNEVQINKVFKEKNCFERFCFAV